MKILCYWYCGKNQGFIPVMQEEETDLSHLELFLKLRKLWKNPRHTMCCRLLVYMMVAMSCQRVFQVKHHETPSHYSKHITDPSSQTSAVPPDSNCQNPHTRCTRYYSNTHHNNHPYFPPIALAL